MLFMLGRVGWSSPSLVDVDDYWSGGCTEYKHEVGDESGSMEKVGGIDGFSASSAGVGFWVKLFPRETPQDRKVATGASNVMVVTSGVLVMT